MIPFCTRNSNSNYLYNIVTAAIVFTEHLDVSESVEPVNGQITAIAKALDHPFSYCRGSASQSLNRFSHLRFAVRIRGVRSLNPTVVGKIPVDRLV